MPDWFPDWRAATCIIVASGPSAKEAPLELARGKAKVVVINRSWRLAPWADVLYGCDAKWWRSQKGVPEFAGLKISQDITATQEEKGWSIRLVRTDRSRAEIIRKPLGRIGWGGTGGGHGGFHAINLAVQFGAKRLLLVGFDMRVDRGVHWHGPHPKGLNNPTRMTVEKWRKTIDALAPSFLAMGVEVINCSPVSALTAFPKMSLERALGIDGDGIAAAAA